jgi:hypothetical protein
MGIAASIVELLRRERIPYTWFQHKAGFTAQEEAAISHIRGRSWAKVATAWGRSPRYGPAGATPSISSSYGC